METVKQFVFMAFFALLPITSAYAQQNLIVRNSETGESFEVEIPDGLTITADGWTDSVEVYREHARQGDVEAYRKLARCYEDGVGVETNFVNMMYLYELADYMDGKRDHYYFRKSRLGRMLEDLDRKYQDNDSIGVEEILAQINNEWPSFLWIMNVINIENKNELIHTLEPEAQNGDMVARLVLASMAADSVCSDACISELEEVAAYAPMMYNKLGRIYMGNPDSMRTDIDRAIDYFRKADEYAMLSRKGAKGLLECYRIKLKRGEKPCDDMELSRLRRLSEYRKSTETE